MEKQKKNGRKWKKQKKIIGNEKQQKRMLGKRKKIEKEQQDIINSRKLKKTAKLQVGKIKKSKENQRKSIQNNGKFTAKYKNCIK